VIRETVGNPTHRSGPELAARGPLDTIFHPSSVAVIGATDKPGSVGRTILTNLLNESFGGAVHAVNSRRDHVLGVRAYPTVSAVPEPVDLAVIVTPAPTVPGLIEECGKAGVKSAIVISAGFKETGADGRALEARILEAAGQSGMRIIGPNCLGVMNPITGFNATFANSCALPGSVGFISQSGALCTAILDWSMNSRVGFSAFVSIGSMLDVDWGDLIYWLGDDPNTKSIVLYMESIGDPKAFLSAAREIALIKPIIVLKAGKTDLSARAAASHTGALAGSTDVLDAAFRRTGVLQVGDIESLFYMAEILGKQPRPLGPRLTILTNAGGPGVLASDSLLLGGGQLATLSESTLNALNEILPPHWSHNNPIDVLGDAAPDRYAASVELASKDPDSDGLLVVLTPQAMTDPTRTAEAVANLPSLKDKPILASWMGGPSVAPGRSILNESGIATFDYPDTAARVFNYMWRYAYDLQELYETPTLPADSELHTPNRAAVNKILNEARDAGQTLLPEIDSHELLAAYGIPVVPATLADSETAAAQIADKIGYPVVIKLHSKTITHKTDVGGVRLNLSNREQVIAAYRAMESSVREKSGDGHFLGVSVQPMVSVRGLELIIGSSIDPQLGPVLLFGAGGQLVEVFRDRALGLPPLNSTLARRLMEQTKIFTALQGVRGQRSVDLAELEQLLVRFSQLVCEQPRIREIDINPLLASPDRLVALDARVVLHDWGIPDKELPSAAIRIYPHEYYYEETLDDGTPVTIRPIRPEDEPLMVQFHKTLSDDTVHSRYFSTISLRQRTRHERLTRMCFIDYDRAMALVAIGRDGSSEEPRILGVVRYSKSHMVNEGEFAIVVSDSVQGKGLGTKLMERLLDTARAEKLDRLHGLILAENHVMRGICGKLGFVDRREGGGCVRMEKSL